MAKTPAYWDYLKLNSLLSLQDGLGPDEDDVIADELHFIVVHQVYELWFKLIIRSLRLAVREFDTPKVAEEAVPYVVHHLRRVNVTLQLAVEQFRLMETLTPQDFMRFRTKLTPSSGFQSHQMRVMEILMGLEESKRIRYGNVDPLDHIRERAHTSDAAKLAWAEINKARGEKSLLQVLNEWLYRTPIQGSRWDSDTDDEAVTAFLNDYLERANARNDDMLSQLVAALGEERRAGLEARFEGSAAQSRAFLFAQDLKEDTTDEERKRVRRVRAALLFIESYRTLPLLAWPRTLLDVVVEMEEQLLLWRNRHARAVERIIGRRVGTGGSSGVDYLDKTRSYRVFTDLWAIRAVLLPQEALPPLEDPDMYGFARVWSVDP